LAGRIKNQMDTTIAVALAVTAALPGIISATTAAATKVATDATVATVATKAGGVAAGLKVAAGTPTGQAAINVADDVAAEVSTGGAKVTSMVSDALGESAVALRDDLVDVIKVTGLRTPTGKVPPTVVGAVNTETGVVGAGATLNERTNGGECAEAWAGRAVGVEPSKKAPVQFTPAVRPRTGENVDTCQGCIFDWSKDKFPFLR